MNQLDPIKELYDMYLEEEDTPRIVEIEDDGLDFVSDIEGLADLSCQLTPVTRMKPTVPFISN